MGERIARSTKRYEKVYDTGKFLKTVLKTKTRLLKRDSNLVNYLLKKYSRPKQKIKKIKITKIILKITSFLIETERESRCMSVQKKTHK